MKQRITIETDETVGVYVYDTPSARGSRVPTSKCVPCPFCGFSNLSYIVDVLAESGHGVAVSCDNCGVVGPPATGRKGAIYYWTERFTDGEANATRNLH